MEGKGRKRKQGDGKGWQMKGWDDMENQGKERDL